MTATETVDEGEIQFRKYFMIIIKRRRLIATLLLITIIAAIALRLVRPPPYRAVALVALIKSETDIAFDSGFRTLTQEDLAIAGIELNADAQRQAFLGLVTNGTIAELVSARLAGQLSPEDSSPGALLDIVESRIVNK